MYQGKCQGLSISSPSEALKQAQKSSVVFSKLQSSENVEVEFEFRARVLSHYILRPRGTS